jgi:zinc-ribbon domain
MLGRMNVCQHCGEPLKAEQAFCPNCAEPVLPAQSHKADWDAEATIPEDSVQGQKSTDATGEDGGVLGIYWDKRPPR